MLPNYFQAATSESKLRGRYYTPPELVQLILERLNPTPDDVFLDPACGDGEFLVGVAAHFAAKAPAELSERLRIGASLAGRLVGCDVSEEAVTLARRRVAAALADGFGVAIPENTLPITRRNVLESPDRDQILSQTGHAKRRLMVVGNPPFVEAKRLSAEARARLKALFPQALGGAPDLYLYFLALCLSWLRNQDHLALVLPNKVLVNANARGIRERLLDEEQLAGIDFATKAGLFAGAAVYPIVLYAAAPRAWDAPVGLRRIERVNDQLTPETLGELPHDRFNATAARALFPLPPDPIAREALLTLLDRLPEGRLGDHFEVRWTVSFHRQGLRERFVTPREPDSPCARPFLGGGTFAGNADVTRYRAQWSGWWIDYDRERLRAEGNPIPPPALFEAPKVIVCQNGRTLRAAYDAEGYVLKDTLLCVMPRESDHPLATRLRALAGLLCSQTIHFYYSHLFYGGHVGGGYLHFLSGFLADVPLGKWSDEAAAQMDALVAERETEADAADQAALEAAMERIAQDALGLSAKQREAIAHWASEDENWLARERIRGQPARK